jgi:hypothetical protein
MVELKDLAPPVEIEKYAEKETPRTKIKLPSW